MPLALSPVEKRSNQPAQNDESPSSPRPEYEPSIVFQVSFTLRIFEGTRLLLTCFGESLKVLGDNLDDPPGRLAVAIGVLGPAHAVIAGGVIQEMAYFCEDFLPVCAHQFHRARVIR